MAKNETGESAIKIMVNGGAADTVSDFLRELVTALRQFGRLAMLTAMRRP
jgi:hypothetical protein